MLRHFQVKSDAISYASGRATVTFQNKVQPGRRAAIIGMIARAAEHSHATQNVVRRLQIAGRSYAQGDPFPLSFIAGISSGRVIDNGGGTASNIIAAFVNTGALTDSTGGTANTTLAKVIRAKGVHIWAGGAAAEDSIAVVGLLPTDEIVVNLSARGASSPTSVIGVNDAGNDQIDLLLDQNGEDAVTLVDYVVYTTGANIEDNFADLAAQLAIQRTLNTALLGANATLAAEVNRQGARGASHGYWPGGIVPIPGGVGRAGAIRVEGGEKIEVELEDLTETAAPITELILHCVEFPRSPENPAERTAAEQAVEQLWAVLREGGGELLFMGNTETYASGAALNVVTEAEPKHPASSTAGTRRLELRAQVYTDSDNAPSEADADKLTVEAYTSTEGKGQTDPVWLRALAGDGQLNWPGAVAVDLRCGESSLVRWIGAAPSADAKVRALTIFAGRHPSDDFLHASGAAR